MTAADLKDGYLVKLKSNELGLVVTDNLGKMIYGKYTRITEPIFPSDVPQDYDDDYVIVEVYGHILGSMFIWDTTKRELLWRADPLKVTMKDIEKKFGRPVLIVEKSN